MSTDVVALIVLIALASAAASLAMLTRASKRGRKPRRQLVHGSEPHGDLPVVMDNGTSAILVKDPVSPDRELLVQFLERSEAVTAPGTDTPDKATAGLTTAVNQLIASLPAAAVALESGRALRIVGPPSVLEGLASGTLELVTKDGNVIGTVKDVATGQFAGQAQFAAQGVTVATGALAAFQVMSIVTGQYYLHRIDSKLQTIDRKLDDLLLGQQAEAIGRLMVAARVVRELREQLLAGVHPTDRDAARIDDAWAAASSAYGRTWHIIDRKMRKRGVPSLDELKRSELETECPRSAPMSWPSRRSSCSRRQSAMKPTSCAR